MAAHSLFLNSKKWTSSEGAPVELRRSTDAVSDGSKVYIRPSHVKDVYIFDIANEKWNEATMQCTYFRSSLVIVNSTLIAVGGTANMATGHSCTNELFSITIKENKKWSEMIEKRSRCTAITCQHEGTTLLIVAGGENPVGKSLTTVEILNTMNNEWMVACSLPEGLYSCSSAVVKDYLYLLGGWNTCQTATNKVFRCQIKSLYENNTVNKMLWEKLPTDLPVSQTTCVAFKDHLLTFGGTWCHCYKCKCNKPTKNIHEFDEDSEEFECVGSTPKAQYLCLACATDNTIFVAGGAVNKEEALYDVYILKTD